MGKQIAVVIGALRGISRQVATHRARKWLPWYEIVDIAGQCLIVVTSTVVVSAKATSDAELLPAPHFSLRATTTSKANPFPPNPNSPQSTINTVAREIQVAEGSALALAYDVRDFENVTSLVE